MASVELSADVPISPQDTWDHVSELSELGEWLVIHEGWRSELPDQLGEGVQIVGVARAMGMRNRVTWRVTKWDPPHEVAMTGSGKGGTKYGVTLTVRPTKGGSALGLRLETPPLVAASTASTMTTHDGTAWSPVLDSIDRRSGGRCRSRNDAPTKFPVTKWPPAGTVISRTPTRLRARPLSPVG